MAWRNAGTVTVTNNSVTVTGVGTGFDTVGDTGQSFLGPDGLPIEIASVDSATQITLASPYRGATAAGASYRIMPVVGGQNLRSLAIAANELLRSFGDVRDGIGQGIFPSGSVGTPGFRFSGDEDTGFSRPAANTIVASTNGVERTRTTDAGLGIGITPSYRLDVSGSNDVARLASSSTYAGLLITDNVGTMRVGSRSGAFIIDIGGVERIQVNTSGNVGINGPGEAKFQANGWSKFADNGTFAGITLQNTQSSASVDTVSYVDFRNQNNYSDSHFFFRHRVDGSSQFEIGLTPAGSKTADRRVARFSIDNAGVYSGGDNTMILGWSGNRWAGASFASAPVVTSDEREKLWHGFSADLKGKARRIARAIMDELGWYQFLDRIEEKGEDGARWHFGTRAQVVWGFVAAEGLCAPLVGEGVDQRPDPEWTGATPPAWLCWDIWEDRYEPIMEEQQIDTETVVIGQEPTGLLDAAGQPMARDITEERPVMGMVEVGQTLKQAAGNRFGLRVDQMGLLLDWELRQQAKDHEAEIAELHARVETLEAA